MSTNFIPNFILTPNVGFGRVTVAQTARDGSEVSTKCFTAGLNGSRVDKITVTSSLPISGTNSQAAYRIYIGDTLGNYKIYQESLIQPFTASTTTIGYYSIYEFPGGLLLGPQQTLSCAISVYAGTQDQFDFIVEGYDF
jgi:hypothetical protein